MIGPFVLPRNPVERVPVAVFPTCDHAARSVAGEIAALIRSRQQQRRLAVLGLATGSTPVGVYAELVRLHREEDLSFANVTTFNLDEYYPLPPEHSQSFRSFMRRHLFDHVDLLPERTHLPPGNLAVEEIDTFCSAYEEKIRATGGIDIQLLGIGVNGHIGFNEPGSSRWSRTRLVTLAPSTRQEAAGRFGGEDQTPRQAVTMGIASIIEARRVVMMACGAHKRETVHAAVEGEALSQIPASFLQEHGDAVFVLDRPSAAGLSRFHDKA